LDERLFPYQKVGAKWLTTKKRALLADEMGLGKSAQAITACDLLQIKRILVLCPAVGRLNWIQEFREFSKRENWRSVLQPVFSDTEFPAITSGIICSYNLMTHSSVSTWILSQNWDLIVLDEVHYLKNRNAQRTIAVYESLVGKTKYVWALTGTPVSNHGGELYTLLRAFGAWTQDYWTFIRRFCNFYDTPFGIKITGTKRIPELRALFAPFTLRRRKVDVWKDAPPLIYSVYAVEAGPVDMQRWYPQLETHMKTVGDLEKELAEQKAAIDAVVNITGLGDDGITALSALQVRCRSYRKYVGLQKVQAVVELITGELESGAYDKKVIFCIHQNVVEDLREQLRKFNPVIIYGGTPPKKRYAREKKFQKDPECKLLIGNIEAAGIVINLTAAHHVDIVESSWVPSDNAQAVMRLHRYPQTMPVNVRFIYLPGSSDEQVQRVIRTKTADITRIMDPKEEVDDPFAD